MKLKCKVIIKQIVSDENREWKKQYVSGFCCYIENISKFSGLTINIYYLTFLEEPAFRNGLAV